MAPNSVRRPVYSWMLFAAMTLSAWAQATPQALLTFRDPRAVQLKAAIASSNLERVRTLVAGVATNDCLELDEQGATALHYAVQRCLSGTEDAPAFQILEELSTRGACVNAADRLGRRPILDLAPLDWMSRSRIDALKILLAHGADPNVQDQNGATLLDQLLRTWNDSALHWPELLQLLLAAKANPNATNSAGETPMHAFFGPQGFCTNRSGVVATRIGVAQRVFTMLSAAGADLTIVDSTGTTPLGTLFLQDEPFFGTKEAILGFISSPVANLLHVEDVQIKRRPALVHICDQRRADADLVEQLLDLGAKPNHVERDGFSPLHGAAWFYNYRVCALLLGHGASANAQDEYGRSPLHELARSSYWHSAYFETDQGADILRTVEVLLAQGSDRRLKDKAGKTALDLLKAAGPPDGDNLEAWRQLRKKLR